MSCNTGEADWHAAEQGVKLVAAPVWRPEVPLVETVTH
jgi:hypothetical protein